jgi:putative ATP-dependent endonuclease of OLD family
VRLSGLIVKNFRRIGAIECKIKIDEIVVLIGPNNAGKSTVLDAYELFASAGKEVDISHFHGEKIANKIEITGIFNELTQDDLDTIGAKWSHEDEEHHECIKVRWVWSAPGVKGQKQSYDPGTGVFVDGGVGGWDSLIQSRIPQPIRMRPTDSVDMTQTKIVAMLKDHIKDQLKAGSASTKEALDAIEVLTLKLLEDSKGVMDDISQKITDQISTVFPNTKIEVVPRSKDNLDEKVLGAESFLRITSGKNQATPLNLQGTGLQRALLWSALSVMSDAPKKKAKAVAEASKILLIDEPEAFLHPPTIRSARDSLYDFAINNPNWQVIATTHSPVFIDLSKSHTTIVRVDAATPEQHFISTDKISFNKNEKKNLQMLRACNPVINEFFFFDNIILVEGPTEQIVLHHVAGLNGSDIHVINCGGKANIPMFARILQQFKVPFIAIHDSDCPKAKRKEKVIANAMWTLNEEICSFASSVDNCFVFTQYPHFEGHFFEEELKSGKVDNIVAELNDANSDQYKRLVYLYSQVIQRDASVMTKSIQDLIGKSKSYVDISGLADDWRWQFA